MTRTAIKLDRITPHWSEVQSQLHLGASLDAAALYLALKESGQTMANLAGQLGIHHGEVRRMLNPRHPTKLPRIEAALAALGKRLVVDMRAA